MLRVFDLFAAINLKLLADQVSEVLISTHGDRGGLLVLIVHDKFAPRS